MRLAVPALSAVLLAVPARAQTPVPPAPPTPAQAPAAGRSGPDDALPWAPPLDERVHLRLDFAGAAGCSDVEVFDYTLSFLVRDWDAFAAVDPWPLKITIHRQGVGFAGSGELRDPSGKLRWKDTVPGPLRCVEIHQELVASLTLAVFPPPRESSALPPPAPSCPACPPAPSCSACPPTPEGAPVPVPPPLEVPEPTKPPPERAPLAIRFGAAVWPEFIAKDEGWVGLSMDLGVRYRAFSVGLGAHGDPPLGARSFQYIGSMNSARVIGTLSLCGHSPPFVACLKADAGAILFPNHALFVPPSLPYGAIGGQVGVEYPVAPPSFLIRTTLDLSIPIHPPNVPSPRDNDPLFAIASPNFGLGLGVVWDIGLH
ncbi:MAG: hypothetical protein U0359_32615 [Byssovorax sp.]